MRATLPILLSLLLYSGAAAAGVHVGAPIGPPYWDPPECHHVWGDHHTDCPAGTLPGCYTQTARAPIDPKDAIPGLPLYIRVQCQGNELLVNTSKPTPTPKPTCKTNPTLCSNYVPPALTPTHPPNITH